MRHNKHAKLRRQLLTALPGLIALGIVPVVHAQGTRPSNKWRLEFSEGAKSDGLITFLVTPRDGQGNIVTTSIPDGTRENHVAHMVRDAFREQLPEDEYHIESDDGENVLIKRKMGTPDFTIELLSSNVKAVRIHLETE